MSESAILPECGGALIHTVNDTVLCPAHSLVPLSQHTHVIFFASCCFSFSFFFLLFSVTVI